MNSRVIPRFILRFCLPTSSEVWPFRWSTRRLCALLAVLTLAATSAPAQFTSFLNTREDSLPVPNPYARTNVVNTGRGRKSINLKLDLIRLDEVKYDGLGL